MELNLDWRRESSTVWPEVSYELRPLKVWAFQELLDYWERHSGDKPEDSALAKISAGDGVKLIDVAGRIFPDHVRSLLGLTASKDGQHGEVTLDMLCEETQLLPLAGEIVSRLVAISEIDADDEKN